jgi:phosphotransferase system HPr (HPr) family protein
MQNAVFYSKELPASLCSGLRLRDVARLVRYANRFQCRVLIRADDAVVNAKSLIEVSNLALKPAGPLLLETSGPDARQCLEALWRLMDRRRPPQRQAALSAGAQPG